MPRVRTLGIAVTQVLLVAAPSWLFLVWIRELSLVAASDVSYVAILQVLFVALFVSFQHWEPDRPVRTPRALQQYR